jgi:hypothetical protein
MLDHVLDVANGPKVNVVNLSEYCRMQLVRRFSRSSACIVFRFDTTCQFLKTATSRGELAKATPQLKVENVTTHCQPSI